jgi:hypothetical protein
MKDVVAAKPALALKCLLVGLKSAEKAAIKSVVEPIEYLSYDFQYAASDIEALFKVKSFQPHAIFIDEALIQDKPNNLIRQIKNVNVKVFVWVVVAHELPERTLSLVLPMLFSSLKWAGRAVKE